ncbi:MAG: hypothetical protein ACOYIG_07625 [Acetivibrionales bacterium]
MVTLLEKCERPVSKRPLGRTWRSEDGAMSLTGIIELLELGA